MVGGMLTQRIFAVTYLATTLLGLLVWYLTGKPVMPRWLQMVQWVILLVLFVNTFRLRTIKRWDKDTVKR